MKLNFKTLKLAFINLLTLLVGLGLMSGSVSFKNAQAARFETIPSVQISALGNYRGQYLTVLYAVGSRPFISTEASQLTISQVKESRTVYITDDMMTLPPVQVEKEGFRPSYNMIVVVISPNADFGWINADGTRPQGSSMTNNRQSTLVNVITKGEVDGFIASHEQNTVLAIELKR